MRASDGATAGSAGAAGLCSGSSLWTGGSGGNLSLPAFARSPGSYQAGSWVLMPRRLLLPSRIVAPTAVQRSAISRPSSGRSLLVPWTVLPPRHRAVESLSVRMITDDLADRYVGHRAVSRRIAKRLIGEVRRRRRDRRRRQGRLIGFVYHIYVTSLMARESLVSASTGTSTRSARRPRHR